MKKSNGFTMIEFLVVMIVVATASTAKILETSSQIKFKDEVLNVSKSMETAFTKKWLEASENTSNSKIQRVTINDKNYSYLCMTFQQLKDENYINTNNITGYFQMFVENHDALTFVNATNGEYYIQGNLNDIAKDNYLPIKKDKVNYSVYELSTCPIMLPTEMPFSEQE